jgi:molybdopterin-guanine dinucleotide biosynthesis protein A
MNPPSIPLEQITGLVLAGGRGSRMGGVDKGLQAHQGQPLALHALRRLQPQVGAVMINANRHLETYQAMGVPVWPDALADYPGPLAGFLAGLDHGGTPYLVTVPCDTPLFPLDLVERLARGLVEADAELAIAVSPEAGEWRRQPVFCLMRRTLRDSLAAFVAGGQRKIERWCDQHRCADVRFDEAGAFFNANTPEELQRLQSR